MNHSRSLDIVIQGGPGSEDEKKGGNSENSGAKRPLLRRQDSAIVHQLISPEDPVRLPPAMLMRVCSYLEGSDLARMQMVSRSWKNVFNKNGFWKMLAKRDGVEYAASGKIKWMRSPKDAVKMASRQRKMLAVVDGYEEMFIQNEKDIKAWNSYASASQDQHAIFVGSCTAFS